jgi:hypothetical protein
MLVELSLTNFISISFGLNSSFSSSFNVLAAEDKVLISKKKNIIVAMQT